TGITGPFPGGWVWAATNLWLGAGSSRAGDLHPGAANDEWGRSRATNEESDHASSQDPDLAAGGADDQPGAGRCGPGPGGDGAHRPVHCGPGQPAGPGRGDPGPDQGQP